MTKNVGAHATWNHLPDIIHVTSRWMRVSEHLGDSIGGDKMTKGVRSGNNTRQRIRMWVSQREVYSRRRDKPRVSNIVPNDGNSDTEWMGQCVYRSKDVQG